ncbi:unnamed protein product [Spodoptera exigua]|nr:unnamed protein product [Spodoptera exigua]
MANKRRYSGKKRKNYGNLVKANEAKKAKRQNALKQQENVGMSHENDTEESQLPSTSTTKVDKELEIVESQSETIRVTNECHQTMSSRNSPESHDDYQPPQARECGWRAMGSSPPE